MAYHRITDGRLNLRQGHRCQRRARRHSPTTRNGGATNIRSTKHLYAQRPSRGVLLSNQTISRATPLRKGQTEIKLAVVILAAIHLMDCDKLSTPPSPCCPAMKHRARRFRVKTASGHTIVSPPGSFGNQGVVREQSDTLISRRTRNSGRPSIPNQHRWTAKAVRERTKNSPLAGEL